MNWLFFSLATPFFFTITNYIEKFLIEKKVKDPIFILILGGVITSLIGVGIACIHPLSPISFGQFAVLCIVGILLMLYVIPYFKALSVDETSRVIPLFQFVPIFVLVLSQIFLDESITAHQFVGFILTLVGAFLLSMEKIEGKIFKLRPAFWYMMLSSFLYAITAILFKYVVVSLDFWTTFAYQSLAGILGSIVLLFYKPYRTGTIRELRAGSPLVFLLLVLSVLVTFLAEFCSAYAYTLAPTALVTAVGGIQPLFVLLCGIALSVWFPHLIKEDISRKNIVLKLFSIGIILAGIYFIYF